VPEHRSPLRGIAVRRAGNHLAAVCACGVPAEHVSVIPWSHSWGGRLSPSTISLSMAWEMQEGWQLLWPAPSLSLSFASQGWGA
jgi:hypothetical protein